MRIFTQHPSDVGETYFEHMGQSFSFGARMLAGGFCCLMHGLFPFMFTKTGSYTIEELHDCMVLNRRKHKPCDKVEV